MKAAVLREVGGPLEIEEVQVDRPGPREVLIRTGATGVCHSDLHFIEGKYRTQVPIILGHEAAGTVEAVGDQVSYVVPGDGGHYLPIGLLRALRRLPDGRRPVLCTQTDVVRAPGEAPRLSQGGAPVNQFAHVSSFAEHMLVHEHAVVKVDDDVPLDRLALIGCGVTTGMGAVFNTVQVGQSVPYCELSAGRS